MTSKGKGKQPMSYASAASSSVWSTNSTTGESTSYQSGSQTIYDSPPSSPLPNTFHSESSNYSVSPPVSSGNTTKINGNIAGTSSPISPKTRSVQNSNNSPIQTYSGNGFQNSNGRGSQNSSQGSRRQGNGRGNGSGNGSGFRYNRGNERQDNRRVYEVEPNRYGSKKPNERNSDFQEKIPEEKLAEWRKVQSELQMKQVTTDSFSWSIPEKKPITNPSSQNLAAMEVPVLEYVGGIDIACSEKTGKIVVCLAIQKFRECIYYLKRETDLTEPYKAGFQAFREGPAILEILKIAKQEHPEYYPQVSDLLYEYIPTIGVAKNLLWIRGEIEEDDINFHLSKLKHAGDYSNVHGRQTNFMFGSVMLTSYVEKYPYLYISTGHRVSLKSAVQLVLLFDGANGMPSPIKYADVQARKAIGEKFRNKIK
ncbi:hypothetical protein HK096_011127 [Nowakowskiella sp. JEL0078]|nr:hypothetical protein HK096_011127 [Nowakowskiella sp. JEL0078]